MSLFLVEFGEGKLFHPGIDQMAFDRIKWLDLENPSEEELLKVCGLSGCSRRDLDSFLDRDELPRVGDIPHFSIVVYKTPFEHEHKHHLTATTVTFLVSDRLLISIHRDPVPAVNEIRKLPEQDLLGVLSKGTNEMVYLLIEGITNEFYERLDTIQNQINHIENSVFAKPDARMVKKIFDLKRTLIYFHKALTANRDILLALQKPEVGVQIKDPTQQRIDHFYYDMVQLIDVAATYRDILTGALDIYLSAVNNNMNMVMKQMAAYGSLVLIPTFIVGLYGMNFTYLPELDWKYGYAFAWALILGSMALLFWFFKKKDWF